MGYETEFALNLTQLSDVDSSDGRTVCSFDWNFITIFFAHDQNSTLE